MTTEKIFDEALKNILSEDEILKDEPMKHHTTFRVGGPAEYYLRPKKEQVAEVLRLCLTYQKEYLIIGNGSNLLVSDKGISGVVIEIGKQMDEIYRCHEKISKKEAKMRSIKALKAVGIPDAELRYHAFPHELSGGMRQRVLIAMAFACEPEVIIADEPTTALDVTIQAQILELLSKMQKEKQTALLLITHDLSVVRSMADRIAVMYSGKIVEEAPAKELLENPLHPYTKGLMAAVARLDDDKKEFVQIPGHLPDPADKPAGCYFHPRCPYAATACKKAMPLLTQNEQGRKVRCYEAGKFKE